MFASGEDSSLLEYDAVLLGNASRDFSVGQLCVFKPVFRY
jgi:hypothetical protein